MLKRTLITGALTACAAIGATQTFAPVWSRLTDPAANLAGVDVRTTARPGGGVFAGITRQASGGWPSTYAVAYSRPGAVAWRSTESFNGYVADVVTVGSSMVMAVANVGSVRLVRFSSTGSVEWSVPVDLALEASFVDLEATANGIAILATNSDLTNGRLITYHPNGVQRWRSGNLPNRFRLKVEGDFAYVGGYTGAEPTSRLTINRFSMGGGTPTVFSDGVVGYTLADFAVDQGSILAVGTAQAGTQGIRFVKVDPSMGFVHGSVFSSPQAPNLEPDRILMDRQGRVFISAHRIGSNPIMAIIRGGFFDNTLQLATTRPGSDAENFFSTDLDAAPDGSVFHTGLKDTSAGVVPVIRRFNGGGGLMGERNIPNGWLYHQTLVDALGDVYSGGGHMTASGVAAVLTRYTVAPIATTKAYALAQNGELNVTNAELGLGAGQEGTVTLVSSPARGSLTFQSNGTFRYVPGRNFVGVDQFDYQIERAGMTARGTARITTECRVVAIDAPERIAAGVNGVRAVIRLTGPAAPSDVNVQLHYSPEISGPLSVTIPRGVAMATVELSTAMVSGMTNAYVQASYGQNFVQKNIQVRPGQLSNFGVIQEAFSGNEVTGDVRLDGLNNNAVSVHIQSSNPSALYVPGPVVVPARSMGEGFAFRSSNVVTDTPVTLTASANGIMRTASTRICAPQMSDFTLEQTFVQGGEQGSAYIKIFGVAGPGGLQISLRDNSSFVSLPMTVTIPAGEMLAEFPISTQRVSNTIRVTLTAQLGPQVANRILEVRP